MFLQIYIVYIDNVLSSFTHPVKFQMITSVSYVSILAMDTFSAVEKTSDALEKLPPDVMGNVGHLSLEPVIDKQPVYSQLLQTYKWHSKVRSSKYHCM